MTVIRKPIGRLPLNLGDYDSTRVYGKKNRVFMYGCEWESKVENNTYAPAALNTQAGTITPDATHWKLVSGSYEMWLVDHGYKTMDYVPMSQKGQAGGVATLDNGGKVPAEQLPSYVDDVVDLLDITGTAPAECAEGDLYYNSTSKKIFTATGVNTWGATGADPEKGKIYMNLANGNSYRWSGSVISPVGNPDVYSKSEVDGLIAAERSRAQGVENNKQDTLVAGTNMDTTPTSGSNKPITSGGVKTYVDNKTDDQDTVIANAIAAQNAEIDSRMDQQDAAIALLNGNEVIVVADHTAVSIPDSQKIYREYGTNSYTDYWYQNGAWQVLANYDYPGVDDEPMIGSDKLVKSGGVAAIGLDEVMIKGMTGATISTADGSVVPTPDSTYRSVTPMFTPISVSSAIILNGENNIGFFCYDKDFNFITQFKTKTNDDYRAVVGVDIPANVKYVRTQYRTTNNYTATNLRIVDVNDKIADINTNIEELKSDIRVPEVFPTYKINRDTGEIELAGVSTINASNLLRIDDIASNIVLSNVRCSASAAGYAFYDKYGKYISCDSGLAVNVTIPTVTITPQQIPLGAVYIRASFSSPNNLTFSNCHFENAAEKVESLENLNRELNEDQYPYIGGLALIGSIAKKANAGGSGTPANSLFTIAHASDFHLDYDVSKRFFDVVNSFSIDMGIITGDLLLDGAEAKAGVNYGTFAEFSQYLTDSPKTLFCVGNHESMMAGRGVGNCNSLVYNKFFAPWISRYGENFLSGHNCYYIDKIVTGGTVRVIVLNEFDYPDEYTGYKHDCIYSQAQIDWFIDALEDAASKGYYVICVEHTKMTSINAPSSSPWADPLSNLPTINNFVGYIVPDIVEAWKNASTINNSYAPKEGLEGLPTITVNHTFNTAGKFVCHINGHDHADRIGMLTNYTQLCINVTMGNGFRHEPNLPRTRVDYTIDAFNLYAFDLVNNIAHVARYGSDYPVTGILRHYGKLKF